MPNFTIEEMSRIARSMHSRPSEDLQPVLTDEQLKELYIKMRQVYDASGIPLERVIFVDEFHSFILGSDENAEFRSIVAAAVDIVEALVRMRRPQKMLFVGALEGLTRTAPYVEEVSVLNTVITQSVVKYCDVSKFENVTTVNYSEIDSLFGTQDMAVVYCQSLGFNEHLLDSVIGSLKEDGVLAVSNSSDLGNLYENGDETGAYLVHQQILNSGLFTSFHIPTQVAFTIYVRHGN
jgi:phosphopentomutase